MTIRDTIDANSQREVNYLKSLVKSPSDNPPGDCAPIAEVAAKGLESLGFTVERHPVPPALVAANGMKSVTNLIVRKTFGSGKGPVIALNAHGDVVPPGAGWTVDPYGAVEKNGALYGRGVAVSKSDFATFAFALLALESNTSGLNGVVELHFTFDEEAGGMIGPKWLIDQKLTRATLAISAGFSYAITTAHNGVLHLEVTVRGKQAHAAMPATGVPLYTDARHYAAAGVPIVLYGAGPRSIEEANAHRADERVPLEELHRATLVVALTLADFLAPA
jgi:acetylornithine deacetylase/succinyl-diaminopimelate desuccinylase-like protein